MKGKRAWVTGTPGRYFLRVNPPGVFTRDGFTSLDMAMFTYYRPAQHVANAINAYKPRQARKVKP